MDELSAKKAQSSSRALRGARQAIQEQLEEQQNLRDLDSMTEEEQLNIKLVQLAQQLEERTKWEAVRMPEFMALKEKEVSNECKFRRTSMKP